MKYRKTYYMIAIITVLLFVTGLSRSIVAAEIGTIADAMVSDDLYGDVTFVNNADNSITITFAAQSTRSFPSLYATSLMADVGICSGAFVGDYISNGVMGLKFNIVGDGHKPSSIAVVLKNKDGRSWCNRNVVVSENAGQLVVNTILLERSAGWDRNERSTVDKDAMWLSDLHNVGTIGIRLTQGGIEKQSYTLSEFVLIDINGLIGIPGALTPLQDALLTAFGVASAEDVSSDLALLDSDADGMTDLVEILSEHDLSYANSIFVAEILGVSVDGMTIKWACVKDAEYMVLRTTDLTQSFTVSPSSTWTKANETGFMTYIDLTATNNCSYFYMTKKRVAVSDND